MTIKRITAGLFIAAGLCFASCKGGGAMSMDPKVQACKTGCGEAKGQCVEKCAEEADQDACKLACDQAKKKCESDCKDS